MVPWCDPCGTSPALVRFSPNRWQCFPGHRIPSSWPMVRGLCSYESCCMLGFPFPENRLDISRHRAYIHGYMRSGIRASIHFLDVECISILSRRWVHAGDFSMTPIKIYWVHRWLESMDDDVTKRDMPESQKYFALIISNLA